MAANFIANILFMSAKEEMKQQNEEWQKYQILQKRIKIC